MYKYLILQHPGHNRVYYNAADKLALAELKIASQKLTKQSNNVLIEEIAGVRYISLSISDELNDEDIQTLSKLSFVFAMFSQVSLNGSSYLVPISKYNYEYINPKISSVLKYHGKTNELFTKMMINVGVLSSDYTYEDRINILDPVAGRGTTLFEGAVYGCNVFGVEIEAKSVHDTAVYFKKFLEEERYKHVSKERRLAGASKKDAIVAKEFEFARTKQEFKSKETTKSLTIVNGKSQDAFKYFKNNRFHLIVGDLPYGIVHGNTSEKKNDSITRNPTELLENCVGEWYKVLKPGGVSVIAWNAFVAPKQKLSSIFTKHGFHVLSDEPYVEFEHMVDKSIKRDIIVAKKA